MSPSTPPPPGRVGGPSQSLSPHRHLNLNLLPPSIDDPPLRCTILNFKSTKEGGYFHVEYNLEVTPPLPYSQIPFNVQRRYSEFYHLYTLVSGKSPRNNKLCRTVGFPNRVPPMDREGRLLRCKKLQEFVTMLCDEYTDLCGVTKNFIASFLSLPMTGVTMFVEKYVVKEISPGEFKNFFKIKVSANGGGEVTREARYSELRVLHYRMCILNPQSMGRLLFEFPSKTQSLIESGRQCVRRRRAELNNYVRGVNGLVMSGGMLREWLEFFDCDETGVARGASREDDGVVRRGVNLMEETPPTQVPNTRVPEAPDSAGSSVSSTVGTPVLSTPGSSYASVGSSSHMSYSSILGSPSGAGSLQSSRMGNVRAKFGKIGAARRGGVSTKQYLKGRGTPLRSISDYCGYFQAVGGRLKARYIVAALGEMSEVTLPPDDYCTDTCRVVLGVVVRFSKDIDVVRAGCVFFWKHTRGTRRVDYNEFVECGGMAVLCYGLKKSLEHKEFVGCVVEFLEKIIEGDREVVGRMPGYADRVLLHCGALFEGEEETVERLERVRRWVKEAEEVKRAEEKKDVDG